MAIDYQIDQRGVATVTLNRAAKRNAFDDHMIEELSDAFNKADQDPTVRVLVLRSTGKHFSAGADLAWMQSMVDYSFDENLADANKLANMLASLNQLSKPTIARVQGAAFGGAVGLVSCCDIAIGTSETSFCLSEVKLGLVPATIGPFVVEAIGRQAARRYFQTAEAFDAKQALSLGLLSLVVNAAEIDQAVENMIENVLPNSAAAMATSKKLVFELSNRSLNKHTLDEALTEHTCEVIARARVSDDAQQRLKQFIQARAKKDV